MNQRQLLWLRIALGALLVVIFAPSISASLVWDDRYLLGDNPALDDLGLLLSSDIFSATSAGKSDVLPTSGDADLLAGASIGWGAVGAHVLNILIHSLVFWGLLKLLDGWQRQACLIQCWPLPRQCTPPPLKPCAGSPAVKISSQWPC